MLSSLVYTLFAISKKANIVPKLKHVTNDRRTRKGIRIISQIFSQPRGLTNHFFLSLSLLRS